MKPIRRRTIGLGPRLSLIAAVALIPALATILYNEHVFRQARALEVHQAALRTAELASLEMERIISGSAGILTAMARAPAVRDFLDPTCTPYLQDLGKDLPQFNAISAIDSSGTLRCRSNVPVVTSGYQTQPHFQAVIKDRTFSVGEYMKSNNDNLAILPLAVPINDASGKTVGVLVAGLSLDWLGGRLKERQFASNSSLTIADRNGTILAREPLPEQFVGSRIPESFQRLVRADRPGTLELTSQDGTQRVQGYYPAAISPFDIYVSAGIAKTEAFREINDATARNLLLAGLSAVLAFALAAFLSRQLILQPVKKLQSTINDWRAGSVSARTGMTADRDEISAVGASIDSFLDELAIAREERLQVDRQRDILGRELQHRIKNLFSTVQAIASQTFPKNIAEGRLETFNQRLAAMSQAQSVLMTKNWQEAELSRVVAAATSLFQAPGRFAVDGPELVINARAAMALSMALHELCTNAVKYGALTEERGVVSITWRTLEDSTSFELVWQEKGGPEVAPPTHTGFGTQMIQKVLSYEISGTVELNYLPEGLHCVVRAPVAAVASRSGKTDT